MTPYVHPTTIAEFEKIYRDEYKMELASCDRWIEWCRKQDDWYGINFHEGLKSATIHNNIKMEQLLRVLKQEHPNKRPESALQTLEKLDAVLEEANRKK